MGKGIVREVKVEERERELVEEKNHCNHQGAPI
jgi:hypothetical protein